MSLLPQEERDPAKVRAYHQDEVIRIVESAGFTVRELWRDDYI